jgi:DNA primase large subunit
LHQEFEKVLTLDEQKRKENALRRQQEDRRRDHISHYILRLAYCRTEEMRRWFLTQETELLRCRFAYLCHQIDKEEFFAEYEKELNFVHVEATELDETTLSEVQLFYSGNSELTSCIKVPFTAALDLVQSRQVVMKNGSVYVPHKDELLLSLVCNKFRTRVSEELVKTLHHLAVVDDDERLAPFLKRLKDRYLGEDFNAGTEISGQVHPSQINTLSKESFPPCMRHLHETLRSEHHLKHFGRLQYGLFLKSIGLSLEDALAFWRAEFTKKMDPDKFDKQYAYNVRHSYGKEGKRANYTPYSCMKIIMSNTPTKGDHHGCPFRHWDRSHMTIMLQSHGLSSKDGQSVLEFVKSSHYQLACQKYFEITHKLQSAPFSLEHPSQYFAESRRVRGGLDSMPKTEPGGIESGQGDASGMECKDESVAMDVTADISVKDMEDFESF